MRFKKILLFAAPLIKNPFAAARPPAGLGYIEQKLIEEGFRVSAYDGWLQPKFKYLKKKSNSLNQIF